MNNLLTRNDETVRTQITLTKKIKEEVEKRARRNGESMSEYLRKAAVAKIKGEDNERESLKQLIENTIGSVKLENHPEWSTKKKVNNWVRELRSEW